MVPSPYAGDSPPAGTLHVLPLRGIPEVATGSDLAQLIQSACAATGLALEPGDLVVVSSKVLSKAAGLWADSRTDAVERSTGRVVAERATFDGVTRVVESVAGPVMAAGGVDASNTGGSERVLMLPSDPDAVAASLLDDLLRVTGLAAGSLGVVVTDTAGRPWRAGQTDFALGAAGVVVLDDLRGGVDADGRPLAVTARAVADEVAAAADLVKGKASAVPVAIVRGLPALLLPVRSGSPTPSSPTERPGAGSLVRTGPGDWFHLGHLEAVRAALGVSPGSSDSAAVGIRPLHPEALADRIARVVRLALAGPVGSTSIEVAGGLITVRAAEDFDLGVVVTRLVVAGWTEDLELTTAARQAGLVRLIVTDLAPTPVD